MYIALRCCLTCCLLLFVLSLQAASERPIEEMQSPKRLRLAKRSQRAASAGMGRVTFMSDDPAEGANGNNGDGAAGDKGGGNGATPVQQDSSKRDKAAGGGSGAGRQAQQGPGTSQATMAPVRAPSAWCPLPLPPPNNKALRLLEQLHQQALEAEEREDIEQLDDTTASAFWQGAEPVSRFEEHEVL
jgi:hypothetical protein